MKIEGAGRLVLPSSVNPPSDKSGGRVAHGLDAIWDDPSQLALTSDIPL